MSNDHRQTDSFSTWNSKSTAYLQPLLQEYGQRLAAGAPGMGATWNPFGYATFFEAVEGDGIIPDLGEILFHVWPAGHSGGRAGVPTLHNHSFDQTSAIVAGRYIDRIYTPRNRGATRTEERRGETPEYDLDSNGRKYARFVTAEVHAVERTEAGNFVRPTGDWMSLEGSRRMRVFEPGTVHRLPADVFHITAIPLDQLAVTLSIRRVVEGTKDLLIGRPNHMDRIERREVSPEERQLIADQVAAALVEQDLSRPGLADQDMGVE